MELKTHLAPLFMKEIDRVSEIYMSKFITNFLLQILDLLKEIANDNNVEINQDFNNLRKSIKNRIEEINTFFDNNFDKPYIFYFEKGRIKLQKLLMYNPQTFNEMNNENDNKCYIFGINQQEDEQEHEQEYDTSNISEEDNNGMNDNFFEESTIQMMGKNPKKLRANKNVNPINNVNNYQKMDKLIKRRNDPNKTIITRKYINPNIKYPIDYTNNSDYNKTITNKSIANRSTNNEENSKKSNFKVVKNNNKNFKPRPIDDLLQNEKLEKNKNENNRNEKNRNDENKNVKNINEKSKNERNKKENIKNESKNKSKISVNNKKQTEKTDDKEIINVMADNNEKNNEEDLDKEEKGKSFKKSSDKNKGNVRESVESLTDNYLQFKEIIFRIKLTKEEYVLLMKEKAKLQDSLSYH